MNQKNQLYLKIIFFSIYIIYSLKKYFRLKKNNGQIFMNLDVALIHVLIL